jgi:carbon starvation protein CstA
MPEIENPMQTLVDKAEKYGSTTIQLVKLKTTITVADLLATVMAQVITYTLLGVFLLFFNIALAIWIGSLLGKIYLGFLLVSFLFGVAALAVSQYQNKWIKIPYQNSLIKLLTQIK